MFGTATSTMWVITYTMKGMIYYLSDSISSTVFVWTQRKNKARRYITEPSAADMAATIKNTHKNKKINISVVQI